MYLNSVPLKFSPVHRMVAFIKCNEMREIQPNLYSCLFILVLNWPSRASSSCQTMNSPQSLHNLVHPNSGHIKKIIAGKYASHFGDCTFDKSFETKFECSTKWSYWNLKGLYGMQDVELHEIRCFWSWYIFRLKYA